MEFKSLSIIYSYSELTKFRYTRQIFKVEQMSYEIAFLFFHVESRLAGCTAITAPSRIIKFSNIK